MKAVVAFYVVVLAALALMVGLLDSVQAAKWKLLEGETYLVVVDCLPSYMAPEGLTPDGQRVRGNPCYTEKLTVKAVYEDGWFDAVDADGGDLVWRVNLARVYAVSQVPAPTRRSASR